jgi:hypothetical protein
VRAVGAASEGGGGGTVEPVGGGEQRLQRAVTAHQDHRLEGVGGAVEVAEHVEGEVVAADAARVHAQRAGAAVVQNGNGDDRPGKMAVDADRQRLRLT